MRCLECGVETAVAMPACVVCGAPVPRQSAASGGSGSRAWVQHYSDSGADGAILAEWVQARKFSATRLRPGYDAEEVDAFLAVIRDTFLGIREPSLTPEEIRHKRFSTTRLRSGYDEEEVDAFLEEAEVRLAAQPGARACVSGQWSVAADPAAGAAHIRCLECGADGAEAAGVCARCGAPTGYLLSAAGPAVAQRAERSGPSWRLLIGAASALVLLGGLIAGLDHSRSSTSSIPSMDRLTTYQLRAGDCLRASGLTRGNQNLGNGPFTAVPCTQLHAAEVFFAGNDWPRSQAYPGDPTLYADGYARCLVAFSAYDGSDSSYSEFDIVPSIPDSSTWPAGDRRLVCLATEYGWVDYSIRGSGQ